MHYIPDPKSLVYSELQFISTVIPRAVVEVPYDAIFDEVSGEIYNLYVAEQHASNLLTTCIQAVVNSVTGLAS